jgi:hypothetical protein
VASDINNERYLHNDSTYSNTLHGIAAGATVEFLGLRSATLYSYVVIVDALDLTAAESVNLATLYIYKADTVHTLH